MEKVRINEIKEGYNNTLNLLKMVYPKMYNKCLEILRTFKPLEYDHMFELLEQVIILEETATDYNNSDNEKYKILSNTKNSLLKHNKLISVEYEAQFEAYDMFNLSKTIYSRLLDGETTENFTLSPLTSEMLNNLTSESANFLTYCVTIESKFRDSEKEFDFNLVKKDNDFFIEKRTLYKVETKKVNSLIIETLKDSENSQYFDILTNNDDKEL